MSVLFLYLQHHITKYILTPAKIPRLIFIILTYFPFLSIKCRKVFYLYRSSMEKNQIQIANYLKNPLFTGTILLTLAGFLTKFIGFFYKIFLARIFHEEGLGIIGLLSPIMMLTHSLCAAGLQNAITRQVAVCGSAKKEQGYGYLYTGLIFSLTLSTLMTFIIFQYANVISTHFLCEERCTILLRITSLSFPLASLHTCLNGYFYGKKKASIPALSMLIEQGFRVFSVYVLYTFSLSQRTKLPLATCCVGMFIGECASAVFSCILLLCDSGRQNSLSKTGIVSFQKGKELFSLAAPLSLNRVCMSLLSTLETIQLPQMLIKSGLTSSQALSVYGIFSGMAFPLIMFPCALTGSAGSLLLPYISEQQAANHKHRIKQAVILTIFLCFVLGLSFMIFLLIFADAIGNLLFHNTEVAKQIRALALTCPFLYLSGMLNSILHGLGKNSLTFFFSLLASGCRLLFVFLAVPVLGFAGYLYGILCAQILLDSLLILALRKYIIYN